MYVDDSRHGSRPLVCHHHDEASGPRVSSYEVALVQSWVLHGKEGSQGRHAVRNFLAWVVAIQASITAEV